MRIRHSNAEHKSVFVTPTRWSALWSDPTTWSVDLARWSALRSNSMRWSTIWQDVMQN